jgi:outer membrane protein assembly factor BamB
MNIKDKANIPDQRKMLRLWPGVVIIILQWLVRYILPEAVPGTAAISIFGGILGGLAVIFWWALFSRASAFERWFAILLMIAAELGTFHILDRSLKTAMMGMMFPVFSVPVLSLAFVIWAVASRRMPAGPGLAAMAATIILASGFWGLLRTDGMTAEANFYFSWRWSKTAEEKLLSGDNEKQMMPSDSPDPAKEAVWPGFRGLNRDGIVHDLKIRTDWSEAPPVEIWRRPVGPGCSSFAVNGSLLYTQEQRGENEMVTCYNLITGKPVWRHSDTTRFWDSHAGAGPRSTPTLSNGRVYTLGATGIMNVLDDRDGSLIWSRNAAQDADVKLPGWGYTGSPVVTDSDVIAAVAGKLCAYDIENGNKRWTGPDGGESYSSPQLVKIGGMNQVLFVNRSGVTSFRPSDGNILWKIPMAGVPIIQPAQISESDIIFGETGEAGGKGMRRVSITDGPGGWNVEERWETDRLRPYFNDVVFHKGYVYGFDGLGIACIDAADGSRKWRGGRYGGQLLLLADQDILLVLSEKGDLALVEAKPGQFREIARMSAIKGRTWNHPVLAGNILLVRNNIEMAAFRFPD